MDGYIGCDGEWTNLLDLLDILTPVGTAGAQEEGDSGHGPGPLPAPDPWMEDPAMWLFYCDAEAKGREKRAAGEPDDSDSTLSDDADAQSLGSDDLDEIDAMERLWERRLELEKVAL
eukprot:1833530-Pyramimonas_sp.AAC.1